MLTPPTTTPNGNTPANAKGNPTTLVAMKKAVRCASPNQKPTAKKAPACCRNWPRADDKAVKESAPSRTTNIAASDKYQLSVDQMNHTRTRHEVRTKNDRKG